jgi:hypothetical protein
LESAVMSIPNPIKMKLSSKAMDPIDGLSNASC